MKLLAGTQQPIAGVPVALEPAETQTPPLAAPAKVRDAQAAVRRPPHRPGENQVVVPPLGRNLLLMLEEVLSLTLTERSILLLRPFPHLLAGYVGLPAIEEGDKLELVGGDRVALHVLEEDPPLLRHVAEEGENDASATEATLDRRLESIHDLVERECSLVDATHKFLSPAVELPILLVCDTSSRHDELLSVFGNLPMRPPHLSRSNKSD